MEFSGFRPETFKFFEDLTANNTEEWFDDNQPVFEDHVLEPMRGLVETLREPLNALAPGLIADDVDLHFSEMKRGPRTPPGTPPLKTSMYAFFWDQGVRRLADGNLFVGVSPQGATIGFSIYDFGDPQSRMRRVFKPRLLRHLQLLDEHIKANYLRRGFDFHRYVRAASRLGMREVDAFPTMPTEWTATLGWVARRHLHTESSRLTPGSFVHEVIESFERLHPLYVFASDPSEEFQRLLKPKTTRSKSAKGAKKKSSSTRPSTGSSRKKGAASEGSAVARAR